MSPRHRRHVTVGHDVKNHNTHCTNLLYTEALGKKIQAFENKCMRGRLRISWTEYKTNDYVWSRNKG